LITSVAQHILEMNNLNMEETVSSKTYLELLMDSQNQDGRFSLADIASSMWRNKAEHSAIRFLSFFTLCIIALLVLRIVSTREEIKHVISLLFPIGIGLLPLGILITSYVPNNLGAAVALTGAVCLVIAIIDASFHLYSGTKS
jgi:hypothetical protein